MPGIRSRPPSDPVRTVLLARASAPPPEGGCEVGVGTYILFQGPDGGAGRYNTSHDRSQTRILVVDDDQSLRRSLAEQLELHDEFTTIEADSGSAALDQVKAQH